MAKFIKNLLKTRRRKIFLILLVLLAFGIYYFNSRKKVNPETARVERGLVTEDLILSGAVKAEEYGNLSFLSSGELNFVGVKVGQTVKKGEVLARLDSTNAYQTYLQAEADLRRYQASLAKTYDDVQDHKENESFTQMESRTVAETNKDKAYRAFVIAQKNLANLSLRAPFDGIVASITHPYNGVNTSITESQIEILNPASFYFEVSADQTEVISIKNGQEVRITLDSYPEAGIVGTVSFVGITPKQGEAGSVYEVRVDIGSFGEAGGVVKMGMTGDARFVMQEKEGVMYVPTGFINTDSNGSYVIAGKPGNKVYVEVGLEGEERTEIKGNINEGEVVYD